MLNKREKKILKFIKYAPTIIVIISIVFVAYLFFLDKSKHYNKNISTLKESFIFKSKERIKNEVNRVYDYVLYEKENSERELKINIQNRVDEVYLIIEHIHSKYKNTEPQDKIQERIKDAIRQLKFNSNRGYFYIFDFNGVNVLHPLNPELEGKNLYDFQDSRGNFVTRDIVKGLVKKEIFYYEYYWNKPDDIQNEYKKTTYNRKFLPYNWIIGTGEYIKEFELEVQKKILSYINTIKYSKNGYIFISSYEGKYIAHIKKEYRSINRINLKDKNGYEITKNIIQTAKNGEGYISYIGTIKPETNQPASKTTFVKGFQDWKWAIGTGFYTEELENELKLIEDEVNKENQNMFLEIMIIGLVLTIIFIGVSIYFSKVLEQRFLKYKKSLLSEVKKNKEKDSLLFQQSKMAAMGEMIQNIAHQWRQPLATITTISSGVKLKHELKVLNQEEIPLSMEQITNTSAYLSQTIEDFREFFNPDKKESKFNLKDVFEKVFVLLNTELLNKNIKIIKDINDVEISTYQNELIQVFINLINNSKDEFDKQKIDEKLIFIEVKESSNKVFIKIRDNAGGIKNEIINKVFDSYFTTKNESNGTGIGLYMSKEIIERHMNGSIKVYNDEYIFNDKKYTGALFEIALNKKI